MNNAAARDGRSPFNRRSFLRASSAAAVGLGAMGGLRGALAGGVHHSVDDTIRIGLVGCGGRGTGAVVNACTADSGVRVTALADAFPDRIELCRNQLMTQPESKERMLVTDETCFTGVDCASQLIASDVDVVLLCQPPYFRPQSLKEAVAAGKHVFCEKPVGTDVPGVLSVMETCRNAGNLSIVSGLCWRYDLGVRETVARILDGEIGDIISVQENYFTDELWHRGNRPEWSRLEYQLRNWLYFAWLSGDIPAEQHIHSLDKTVWLMGDTPPAKAYGMGGRQKRTDPMFGNVYDHFATCYEWPNGMRMFSYCRQMSGCFNETEDWVFGTRGKARILDHHITNESGEWVYPDAKAKPSMYDVEHRELFRSIREGKPINNGHYMGISTLVALLGRNVCYTGREITWEEHLADETRLGPASMEQADYDPGPVPVPGGEEEE